MHYCSLNTIYNVKYFWGKKYYFPTKEGEEWKYKVAEKKNTSSLKIVLKGALCSFSGDF